jgi:hypothetical protein
VPEIFSAASHASRVCSIPGKWANGNSIDGPGVYAMNGSAVAPSIAIDVRW